MKQLIIIVLSLGLLIGAGFYIYYRYDPLTTTNYSNISISTEKGDKKIPTGYIIETSEGIKQGNTSQSYELVKVPNEQIKIYNTNIKGQTFYKDEKIINISGNQRIDLDLEDPTEILLNLTEEHNKFLLNLTSIDARQVKFCIDWSFAYVFVKVETDLTKLENNCYGFFDLRKTYQEFNITYQEFTTPTEKDYISLKLIISEFEGVLDKEIKIK